MNETPNLLMQEIWQSQPTEGIKMPLDEIRRRAVKFEKRMIWLNAREYIAGAMGIAGMGYFLSHTHDLFLRIGFGLIIAGLAYALFHLYRQGRPGTASEQVGAQCAEFFLEELERTRKLVSNVTWWYLAPLVPGLLLLAIASARIHHQPMALLRLAISNLLIAGAFIFVIRLNTRAARCLQKQIDELRAAEK